MKIDIQKADFWKRISAWMFDLLLLVIVVTLVAIPLSAIFKFDERLETVEGIENQYREQMKADGLNPDITSDEYEALSEEEKTRYDAVDDARKNDKNLLIGYSLISDIIVTIITTGILIAYLILEFAVPIIFKNGQTLGKKMFGLGVVHTNAIRLRGQAHFIRSVIGKCAIEMLVPVFFLMMTLFGNLGITGAILIVLLLILQIVAVISTKTRSAIHDLISDTVVVDLASQKVFENIDELTEYKNKLHEEMVSKQDY